MHGFNKKYFFKGNYYSVLLKKLLLALALLWLSRLSLYFFNTNYFSYLNTGEIFKIFFFGLRFDLSALIVINSLFIFLQTFPTPLRNFKFYRVLSNVVFYFFNTIGLAANFTDVIYYRFTQKRMTGDIFTFISEDNTITGLIPQFMKDFWYILLLWLFFIFVLIFLSKKIRFKKKKSNKNIWIYYSYQIALFLFSVFVSVIAIRGGFQLKPINIITAGRYTEARNVPLILNTPFTIIKTISQEGIKPVRYFDKKKLDKIYTPVITAGQNRILYNDTLFRKQNVVIIIMESLSSEHVGAFNKNINNYKGFTPFLDSLINISFVFNGFANGKQSIEGIPATLASLPALMNRPYINSGYAGDKINSLASLLGKKGYSTAFYHGGTNGTMDFDGFADIAGFEKYYGRFEYNNDDDYDGSWGIFDEPFFQYFANNLNKTGEPFCVVFFSLSAHHPYKIPKQHQGQFRKGKLDIQEAIMYADYSLKRFFETASKMPWFQNTLFVITADHTSEAALPQYQTRLGMYRIPIIFYIPGANLRRISSETAAQVDIMPSVLSYLNFDRDFIAFGQNLFDTTKRHFAVNYLNNIYQLIDKNFLLEFDGEKSIALYDYKNDILLKNNLLANKPVISEEMENLLKAYIQQYNNRLIENQLTIEK